MNAHNMRNGIVFLLFGSCLVTYFLINKGAIFYESPHPCYECGSTSETSNNEDYISFKKFESVVQVLQTQRKNRILRMCKNQNNAGWNHSKVFDHIIVDDKHKLLYCYVPKVACTNWKRVFLVLQGKNNTRAEDIVGASAHVMNQFKLLSSYEPEALQYRLDNYYKFMFAREPLQRVLSAYLNKFKYVYSDKFQKRFGSVIINRYRKNASVDSLDKGDDLTFSEFVQYLSDPLSLVSPGFNEHWERYNKLCLPCVIKYDFVGMYETIDEDTEYVLKKRNISKLVSLPSSPKSGKTLQRMKNYYSKVSPDLFKKLVDVYSLDYDLFGYPKPVSPATYT